jgi:hypothetical protein
MDPASAIGLATNVMQLGSYGFLFVKTWHQIVTSGTTKEIEHMLEVSEDALRSCDETHRQLGYNRLELGHSLTRAAFDEANADLIQNDELSQLEVDIGFLSESARENAVQWAEKLERLKVEMHKTVDNRDSKTILRRFSFKGGIAAKGAIQAAKFLFSEVEITSLRQRLVDLERDLSRKLGPSSDVSYLEVEGQEILRGLTEK